MNPSSPNILTSLLILNMVSLAITITNNRASLAHIAFIESIPFK